MSVGAGVSSIRSTEPVTLLMLGTNGSATIMTRMVETVLHAASAEPTTAHQPGELDRGMGEGR